MAEKPTYEELEQRISELQRERDEFKRLHDALENRNARLWTLQNDDGKMVFAQSFHDASPKPVEEALRETRQIIEGIIHLVPVRVFWKDRNLVYLGCNALFAKDAGFSDPKDIIGKDDFDLVWREQAELYRSDDRKVMESGIPKFLIEEPQTTPDGRIITHLTSKAPLRSSTGEISGILGTYMDITDRKRAEEALRCSEELNRKLIDTMPDILVHTDLNGNILFVNDVAYQLTGYHWTDIAGKNIISFVDPDDRDRMAENMMLMLNSRLGPREYCLIRKDGSKIFLEVNGDILRDKDGSPRSIMAIGRDISYRKQAEEVLLRENQIIDAILDSTPGIIYLYNEQAKLVRWNKKHEQMTGYSPEELYGMDVLDWFQGDEKSLSAVIGGLKRTLENGFGEAEAELQRKDCSKIPMYFTANSLSIDGKPHFVGIGIDITERKRMDEERKLLSSVIEQAEENVLITDDRRTILYVNPAFERSSGYRCEELKGQKLKKLRSDQHDEGFYDTQKRILDRGEVWMGVIINKGKNGTNFEIEGTISPIRNASGAITHYVAVGRNMSRFRRLEKELQQVQKLDALGTLAGGIAHDFNNVLSAIMGYIEIEISEASQGGKTRHRMENALSSCCRARDLIRQILAFSRQSEQQRKPIEMGSIIQEAIQMLRATLPATIDIKFTQETGKSFILGDPTQIHQIMINLCTNAAHAMRDRGGILEIGLHHVELDATEAANYIDLHPGAYVRMVVRDTGKGMDRETLDRIFDPFFTTKGPGEGSGIGLSVVRGIVKGHGGRISAYGELGKGSTFEVFFPKTENELTTDERPSAGLATGKERILLVDDEESLVAVTSEMLNILGYEVVSANRSIDALALFRSQCDRFHLVVTDLTMPEMTGMELAAEILRIRGDIPILLSTGFSSLHSTPLRRCEGIIF
ncbi:hybrid sensor histidine kinase/response regulator [Desulfatirhabdium butyrativorans]|uniref:hybrid sensor histidine kinase/response regulator n=1 Tax=Desulfatirhabdium butyrativorans TaxID=340467 RepID=UPI0003FE10EB|nr:PAS domain S-box protein [Desulfatirhabdium butyrativorans]